MAKVPLFIVGADYSPKTPTDRPEPLLVHLKCRNLQGERVHLTIEGTKPRFWTERDPDTVHLHSSVQSAKPSSFRSIEGSRLWEVRVDYPWQRRDAAQRLWPHYCADYPYTDQVRFMYGWENVIEVEDEMLKRNHLRPVHIHKSQVDFNEFPLKVMGIDIETWDDIFHKPEDAGGKVVSIAVSNYADESYTICSTVNTSERLVKRILSNQDALEDFVEHDKPIPPLDPDKIHVRSVHNEEDPECALFWWLKFKLDEEDPDILLGHNLKEYDIKYLRNRERLRNRELSRDTMSFNFPDIKWQDYQLMDSMRMYAEQVQGAATATGHASLSWMAGNELGYGKVPRTRIMDMVANDPEMLAVYNIWDVAVVDRVMRVMGLIDFYKYKACMHYSEINCAHSYMVMIENRMAHLLWEKNIVMPSVAVVKQRLSQLNLQFQGGFVLEAASNLWEHAFELDNSKEYPSVIITGNFCPSTRVHDIEQYNGKYPWPVCIAPSGRVYRRDVDAIVPEVLRDLALQRDEVRAAMKELDYDDPKRQTLDFQQRVLKENMNSWYGVLGSGNTEKSRQRPFRLTDIGIAADITEIARNHNTWNKDHIEKATLWFDEHGVHPIEMTDSLKMEFEVIYQDTDSCKVAIKNMSELQQMREVQATDNYSAANLLCDMLNKSYDRFVQETLNAPKNVFFEVKPDAYYRRYFQWGKKKRYAYVDYDGHYGFRGVELRRSSSHGVVKKFQRGLFEVILSGADRLEVNRYIRDFHDSASDLPDTDFGKPHGFHSDNPNTQTYKAVKWSNRMLNTTFELGDKPVLFLASAADKPLPKNRVVALPYGEPPGDFGIVVDKKGTVEKQIAQSKAMQPILEAVGTSWQGAMSGMSVSSFEGFFT